MPKPAHNPGRAVSMRFSAAAGTYHRRAKIQRRVAAELLALLAEKSAGARARFAPARILEIGCGTGVLTQMLAKAFPRAAVDAVDASAAMILKARKRLAVNRRIRWIAADARRLPAADKYPLIASSCALHWIRPLAGIIKRLGAMLEPGGMLAMAVMTRGTFMELNASRRRVAPLKKSRVVLPAQYEIINAAARAGLRLRMAKNARMRETFSSPEQLLKLLHDQGLTGGNAPDRNHALTRSELLRLAEDYRRRYRAGRGIYATYRVFYGIAQKKFNHSETQ
ncbi:MAG: methyltransferase domain-containing protein [Kiritimatiellia bacterium]